MAETLKPIEVSDDEMALDAIAEVPPGGHHFGTQHTLERYETAFYAPLVSDRMNFERWQESGKPDAARRANGIWKHFVESYEQPGIDPAIDEQLIAYAEMRKAEITAH